MAENRPAGHRVERDIEPLDVLVVDDEPFLPDLVVTVLRRAGYRSVAVASATAALEWLERGTVRLLITDQFLGAEELSGLDLVERLWRDHGRLDRSNGPPPVCLVVTACFDPELLESLAAAEGVADVLRKPFDLERLCGRVGELIGPPAGGRID